MQRNSDGLLIGPAAAHPVYGSSYTPEPLPAGLTPEQLREYVGRMGWYHQIDLGSGVLTPGMKSRADIAREWELFALGDLHGKSVLDIGGVDGAYAFLAERDGAAPVAVLDHYLWAILSTSPSVSWNSIPSLASVIVPGSSGSRSDRSPIV